VNAACRTCEGELTECVEKHDFVPPTEYAFDMTKLHHSLARTLSRGRMMQGCRRARCPLPGCGKTVNNAFHGRGPCKNPAQSNAITSAANKIVHTIGGYVANGAFARWTLLLNAGVAFAASGAEDQTIPTWLLPGTFGSRTFPDKVDMVLIVGWDKDAPPPTPGTPGVKIVLVEVSGSHDHHLPERVNLKRSKYAQLARALVDAGWDLVFDQAASYNCADWYMRFTSDRPVTWPHAPLEEGELVYAIHTVILGHCGSHVRTNLAAFAALGISQAQSKELMLCLSRLAVRQLRDCQSAYKRACKLAPAGVVLADQAAPQPAAVTAPAGTSAAGIG
jgi:hypothetical protein